jgi:outer membrane receptor protein involved in Fe transport
MFFFGDYEGLRIIKGLTNAISIPTPCQLGRSNCNGVTQIGNFSDMLPSTLIYDSQGAKPTPFPNNVIPLSRINAVGQNFANLFPTAGSGSCSATTLVCSFVNNQPRTQSADQFDSRIDRYFGEKGMLFGRYSYNNTNTYTPSMLPPETVAGIQVSPGGGTVAYPGPAHQRYQQATVSHVHVFSPALLLELKFGYLRGTLVSLPLNYGVNIATAFGLSGLNLSPDTSGMPNITFANGGYSAMGNASYIPLRDSDNSFSYLGNLKWIKGSHAFSFGGSVVRRRYDNYQSQSPLGIFQFSSQQTNSTFGGSGGSGGNSLASLLLGTAASISRTLSLVALQYRMWEDAAYVQDDWRIRSWLTLNLGLRWDLFTPFVEKHDHLSNFDPTDPATLAGAKMLRIRKSISFTTEVSCGDGSCSSIRREICWASD